MRFFLKAGLHFTSPKGKGKGSLIKCGRVRSYY